MKINRRNFLRSASSLAILGGVPGMKMLETLQEPHTNRKPRIAVFFEPSFPSLDGMIFDQQVLTAALTGWDVTFLGLADLTSRLNAADVDVFLHPYGSAFPKAGWTPILKFLKSGGNWVNLGGVPFSVPVVKEGGKWDEEVAQSAYHKELGITQSFPVQANSTARYAANESVHGAAELLGEFHADQIFELYVRFTETKDFPTEDGSGGARDATLSALVFGFGENGHALAAPFIQIDRMQGDFAGGRWLLANFNGSITKKAIRQLVACAMDGSMEFTARPSFACYREGEYPSFTLRFHRPKGTAGQMIAKDCLLEIRTAHERSLGSFRVKLHGEGETATGYLSIGSRHRDLLRPGLYEVHSTAEIRSLVSGLTSVVRHATGFWIYDERLLAGGTALMVDNDYLLRDGQTCPVTGTTYMGSDVHRKFLFEPNPYLWNLDFEEMKAVGVNMVRTGIWTGWKNYMLDVGAPNEGALRALDALVLTARRHNVPLVFTLFAFIPESWGGENAYLDPRSINAQKEFVTVFANRYRDVNDIVWDLINEPSFCNPQQLWSCRPNYDRFEREAWAMWLKEKYPSTSDEERTAHLQEIYRSPADEAANLPTLDEFADVNVFEDHRPIKVIDYRLFAQDMFARWAKEIAAAIRSNGNPHQLITVGQDEGGTGESPSPQFFGDAVNFTSIHNWWLNDDLIWDNVVTKSPGKPNLVEETGVMFYETMEGNAWRTEEDASKLLERKLAVALGAGGAGYIEWIWNTNPFMKSDNEAAIGLHRADGTAKPELEPFNRIASFFRQYRHLMVGKQDEDVVMVIPHSQMFSTRNYATVAAKTCVRVMHYECGVPMRGVSEYRLDSLQLSPPKLVVLPSPRTFQQHAWETLITLIEKGSTALLTGVIDCDDHWLPVPRLEHYGIDAAVRPITQEEFLVIDGVERRASFRGDKMQRIEKAVVRGENVSQVKVLPIGLGKLIWSPLPLEDADNTEPMVALYQLALAQAGVVPTFAIDTKNPSILIRPTVYREAVLYTFVSECDRDTEVKLTHRETATRSAVLVPAQRAAFMFLNRKDGHVLGQTS